MQQLLLLLVVEVVGNVSGGIVGGRCWLSLRYVGNAAVVKMKLISPKPEAGRERNPENKNEEETRMTKLGHIIIYFRWVCFVCLLLFLMPMMRSSK